jgi:hypothetical protein
MTRQWNILITGSWTGWHAEQWDFQKNDKTMEHSDHYRVSQKKLIHLIFKWITKVSVFFDSPCISWTGWHAEQWDFQKNDKTMEHSDHWIVDWMACRTVGFSKEWKDNGTFWSLDCDWMSG